MIVDGIGDEKVGGVLKNIGYCLFCIFLDVLVIVRKEKDEFLIFLKGGS